VIAGASQRPTPPRFSTPSASISFLSISSVCSYMRMHERIHEQHSLVVLPLSSPCGPVLKSFVRCPADRPHPGARARKRHACRTPCDSDRSRASVERSAPQPGSIRLGSRVRTPRAIPGEPLRRSQLARTCPAAPATNALARLAVLLRPDAGSERERPHTADPETGLYSNKCSHMRLLGELRRPYDEPTVALETEPRDPIREIDGTSRARPSAT
jgi:hypothetical protein